MSLVICFVLLELTLKQTMGRFQRKGTRVPRSKKTTMLHVFETGLQTKRKARLNGQASAP